ncbi:MAG: hypothetical protein SVW57_02215 [Thermodesulfobacteriota bacterium]|nr:hypothetical protein [Thermodesulfobacteriota bacterium]
MRNFTVFVALAFVFLLICVGSAQSKEKQKGYHGEKKGVVKTVGDESNKKWGKEKGEFRKKQRNIEEGLEETKEKGEKEKERGEALGKSEKGEKGRSAAAHEMAIEKGRKQGKKDKGKAWWKFWQTEDTESE